MRERQGRGSSAEGSPASAPLPQSSQPPTGAPSVARMPLLPGTFSQRSGARASVVPPPGPGPGGGSLPAAGGGAAPAPPAGALPLVAGCAAERPERAAAASSSTASSCARHIVARRRALLLAWSPAAARWRRVAGCGQSRWAGGPLGEGRGPGAAWAGGLVRRVAAGERRATSGGGAGVQLHGTAAPRWLPCSAGTSHGSSLARGAVQRATESGGAPASAAPSPARLGVRRHAWRAGRACCVRGRRPGAQGARWGAGCAPVAAGERSGEASARLGAAQRCCGAGGAAGRGGEPGRARRPPCGGGRRALFRRCAQPLPAALPPAAPPTRRPRLRDRPASPREPPCRWPTLAANLRSLGPPARPCAPERPPRRSSTLQGSPGATPGAQARQGGRGRPRLAGARRRSLHSAPGQPRALRSGRWAAGVLWEERCAAQCCLPPAPPAACQPPTAADRKRSTGASAQLAAPLPPTSAAHLQPCGPRPCCSWPPARSPLSPQQRRRESWRRRRRRPPSTAAGRWRRRPCQRPPKAHTAARRSPPA